VADHDFGFDWAGVHSAFLSLPNSSADDWEARRDLWGSVLSGLEELGIPAAIATNPPMSGMNSNYGYSRPGDEVESFGQYAIVSPRYFEVMGIPVISGRTFEPGESGPVTLISDVLAREHFPDEDPLGRTLNIIGEAHTIIGVTGSTDHFGPDAPRPAALYVSYEKVNWTFATLLARGEAPTETEAGTTRTPESAMVDVVRRVVPSSRPPETSPYATHLSNWFRPLRIQLRVVGALGIIGALLAGLGLYANLAYQVRGQLAELGIRMALGASRTRIVTRVVALGLASAAAGLGAGILLWWSGRGHLRRTLGSVENVLSPFAVTTTSVLVLGLAALAVAIPAIRASRADPLVSLKTD
jgi:hypothetical protein